MTVRVTLVKQPISTKSAFKSVNHKPQTTMIVVKCKEEAITIKYI